jgi:signal transduction histidine kinase/CheY-like chemotaxis protein
MNTDGEESTAGIKQRMVQQIRKEARSEGFPVLICVFSFLVIFTADILLTLRQQVAYEPMAFGVVTLINIIVAVLLDTRKKSHRLVPFNCIFILLAISFLVLKNGFSTGSYLYYMPVIIVYIIYGSDLRRKISFRLFYFTISFFLAIITLGFIYSEKGNDVFVINPLFVFRLNASVIISAMCLRYLMPIYINKKNSNTRKNYAETLFQSGTLAYIVVDNSTKEITDYNKCTSLLFELPLELRLNGLYISQFMMRYLAADSDNLEVLMNGIPPGWQGEAGFRTHTKRAFAAAVQSGSFVYNNKEFQLLSIQDVSGMKEPEKELARYKARLENSVKVKTRFLSSMSHELRTPLNGIIGTSNLIMEDETISAKAREQLKLQLYSSEHMLSIINDILDFSKIDSGKMEFNRQSFNLPDILHKIASAFENQFSNKGLAFELLQDDKLAGVNVVSDPVKLSQVLNNLLSNALKFTLQGKVVLQAIAGDETAETITVAFKVNDTGIGIKEDKLDEIFEGFAQVHADDLKRQFGGTGLGLTISKKLVELFGGNLTVESEFGKGACFTFSINFKKQVQIQRPIIQSDIPFAPVDIRGVRVLIVEDNEINAAVLKGFLLKWGIRVKEAGNGVHALELLKYHKFDLILMDLEMPEMNGYTAVNIIRETDKIIPVIAFTATLLEDMNTLVAEAGFDDYILKPFRPAELKKKIEMYSPHRKIEYA